MRDFISINISRDNNYDLIRLFAAMQVVILHSSFHLKLSLWEPLKSFLQLFPGVPIFFFISGMLVTSSLMRSSSLKSYSMKRIKRVYPALWLCLLLSIIILMIFGQINFQTLAKPFLWIWLFCQTTLLQVFNPSEFRDFGVGVVNGSLWTIPVEVSFYFVLPAIVALVKLVKNPVLVFKVLVLFGGILSYALSLTLIQLFDSENIFVKILNVTVIPYFWQFAFGIFAALYYQKLKQFFTGKVILVGAAYIVIGGIVFHFIGPKMGLLLTSPLLYAFIFALGSNTPEITQRSLRGWDISYGLYLVHMLVVNILVETGFSGHWWAFTVSIIASVIRAMMSWHFVEAKVLRRAT